ncbi:carboxypeptidase-like regulatory domain-containing protein [uncultured Algibacter sp.]|uniref:carboxypeptidase-like regulatory domain-containing protein n=1 Tax=uncultured Algibacter sp. TaxID=298659 RepID=UPI0026150E5E|nr:carboxypeptidase-like regulatory domain-containing protein [uncultured Algibacter sp.]
MNQHLNLTISKPCSEKFSRFETTPSGRFCNSCQKEVIDFRNMTDQELKAYFIKNREKRTCGYFKVSQLNTPSKNHEIRKTTNKFLRIAALAVFSLTSLYQIQAQTIEPKTEIVQKSQNEGSDKTQKNELQEKLLSGIVSDETGVLPGTNIVLKDTSIGTVTNFDGEFEFPKPLKEGDVLVVSFLGYATQHIQIKDETSPLNIIMQEDISCVLMGEVDVNEIYESKVSLWQRIKNIF